MVRTERFSLKSTFAVRHVAVTSAPSAWRSGPRTARRCSTRRRSARCHPGRSASRRDVGDPGWRGPPNAATSPRSRRTSPPGSAGIRRGRRDVFGERPPPDESRSANTRSPGAYVVTPPPTASTSPATSIPTRGSAAGDPLEQAEEARSRLDAVEVGAVHRSHTHPDEDLIVLRDPAARPGALPRRASRSGRGRRPHHSLLRLADEDAGRRRGRQHVQDASALSTSRRPSSRKSVSLRAQPSTSSSHGLWPASGMSSSRARGCVPRGPVRCRHHRIATAPDEQRRAANGAERRVRQVQSLQATDRRHERPRRSRTRGGACRCRSRAKYASRSSCVMRPSSSFACARHRGRESASTAGSVASPRPAGSCRAGSSPEGTAAAASSASRAAS